MKILAAKDLAPQGTAESIHLKTDTVYVFLEKYLKAKGS